VATSIHLNPGHFLVVGLGLTGYSVIRYLLKQGSQVTAADSRELPPYLRQVKNDFPEVEIITGEIPYTRFDNFDQVVVSPGIGIRDHDISNPESIVGDIELFVQHAAAPIVAITGSNGKSTVTSLVAEMMSAAGLRIAAGGNIGTPVLDLFDQEVPDFYVLELSSFQLETTCSLRAKSAAVLNISEDHMDRYRSIEDYVEAKKRILNNAEKVILNRDDEFNSAWIGSYSQATSFGLDSPGSQNDYGVVEINGQKSLVRGETVLALASQITLQGKHNVANVLAAMALVEGAGVALTPKTINAALNYGGLPHRCEMVAEVKDVKWINDSKGTNVGATIAAIKGFKQPIILIVGGKGKGADFSPLAREIKAHVSHTILFGEDAELILESFDDTVDNTRVGSLEDAVLLADRLVQPGSVVLFSPACASFDMFDNYEHRGNVFKQLVWELVH
jgi:UDP-N-acetylmuramoylalanine--D-glutamate ligase